MWTHVLGNNGLLILQHTLVDMFPPLDVVSITTKSTISQDRETREDSELQVQVGGLKVDCQLTTNYQLFLVWWSILAIEKNCV